MIYKKHKIKITEGKHDLKVEVVVKGKEFGLIFKKGEKKKAIKVAKQTIDYLSPKESAVIEYKKTTIYVIRLKDKYIAKAIYNAYGAGKMLLEEDGKTKKEVIKNIKKSIKAIEEVSDNIKKRDEKESKKIDRRRKKRI